MSEKKCNDSAELDKLQQTFIESPPPVTNALRTFRGIPMRKRVGQCCTKKCPVYITISFISVLSVTFGVCWKLSPANCPQDDSPKYAEYTAVFSSMQFQDVCRKRTSLCKKENIERIGQLDEHSPSAHIVTFLKDNRFGINKDGLYKITVQIEMYAQIGLTQGFQLKVNNELKVDCRRSVTDSKTPIENFSKDAICDFDIRQSLYVVKPDDISVQRTTIVYIDENFHLKQGDVVRLFFEGKYFQKADIKIEFVF